MYDRWWLILLVYRLYTLFVTTSLCFIIYISACCNGTYCHLPFLLNCMILTSFYFMSLQDNVWMHRRCYFYLEKGLKFKHFYWWGIFIFCLTCKEVTFLSKILFLKISDRICCLYKLEIYTAFYFLRSCKVAAWDV